MEENFIEKKGSGIKWIDGNVIPTTIRTFADGIEYEYPTNAIDRMVIQDALRRADAGLNFPLDHLKNIKWVIVYTTRERQAKYADNMCQATINDIEFIKGQFDSITNIKDPIMFNKFNATSVGNLAYLSLNAPEPFNKKAEEILENYTNYIKSKFK